MAENNLNARVNVSADASPVDALIKVLKRLEKVSADLANSLPAAAEALAEFGGAAEATTKASNDAAKSAKNLDKAVGSSENTKKSTKNLQGYVKTVNNLRAALGKGGPKPENLFGDTQQASNEIKELEGELLSLVNVYRTGFGQGELLADKFDTQSAIQELAQLKQAVSDLSRAAAGPEGLDFNLDQTNSDLVEFNEQLENANNIGKKLTIGEDALIQFQDLRKEANNLANNEIPDIQQELRRIGPAAEDGNQDAIKQVGELSQRLSQAQSRARDLGKVLRAGQEEFGRQVASQNKALKAFGFDKVTAEDIFPDEEQQRLKSIQQNIDRAALQSAERGAVRTSLNAFLAKDKQLASVDDGIVQMTNHLPRLRYALYDVSQSLTVLGGGLIALGVSVIKVNADFERAFADVERTVFQSTDKSARAVSRLRNELVDLSTTIPVGFSDLAQIATLAGQLNVAESRVASFTDTVAKFSATTDVTIDAAATAFGRLDALVKGVDGQFEKLASSILAVGVNSVATESDIIAISGQISSIANIAGFTASELIGFSSALASVGTRPELARGTFTRLFTEIQQSVSDGGTQLEAFARTANQSVDQFTSAWGAGSGADQVVAILRGLERAGTDADRVLAELGITSVRDVPTLLKLAQGVSSVEEQIRIANIGFIEGVELNNQYSIINATLTSRLKVLSNTFSSLIDTVGRSTAGFGLLIDAISYVLKFVERLIDNPITGTLLAAAAAASILSGAVFIFGGALARAIASTVGLLTTMIEVNTAIAVTSLGVSKLDVDLSELTVTTNGTTTSLQALGMAARNAGAQTKGAGFAAGAAKISGYALAVVALIGIVDMIGESYGLWGDSVDKTGDKLENFDSIQAAVARDTELFARATGAAKGEFQLFSAEVKKSDVQLSETGRVIAAVTGQEDLLGNSADGTREVIEKQTFALGANTKELIKQELALRVLADASKEVYNAEKARYALASSEGAVTAELALAQKYRTELDPGIAMPAQELENQAFLATLDVIQNPEYIAALELNGFKFSEWADAVASGNEKAAGSILKDLSPALTKLADDLKAQNPKLFADEILQLEVAARGGVGAFSDYNSMGAEIIDMLKRAAFEQAIFGDELENTIDPMEEFRDAMKASVEDAYGPINAQREMEESVRNLGAAFFENGAVVTSTSEEMQDAITSIIESASTPDEAIAGLEGFYNAIIDGGYASREELELVRDQIVATYQAAAQAQIELLSAQRSALQARTAGRTRGGGALSREIGDLGKQIAAQQEIIKNVDKITVKTGDSADKANLLAEGYNTAREAASKTKDKVEEIEEATEQAVRTLLDYASDLEGVFSRAFGIRFGGQSAIDDIAAAWESFTDNVNDAKNAVQDLKDTQDDLAADVAIKEYFLSVAEAYDDQLRAAKLRTEIADIEKQQADAAKALADAQAQSEGATGLTGQSEQGRQNRGALLGLVKNYQDYITVLAESGASQDELRKATERARKEFIAQATELGFAESEVMMYAEAFDDVRVAIDNVPRNITVEANVNPALQALNELNASLQTQIDKANELNRALNQPVAPSGGGGNGGGTQAPSVPSQQALKAQVSAYDARIATLNSSLSTVQLYGGSGSSTAKALEKERQATIDAKRWTARAAGSFADGGYTGAGGKMQPAGIVHKGEYVVPQKYVNQSTGLPDANFLSQLQNGVRGYAQGGFVGGGMGDGTMMVELSPYDRKLLADAGNVQLRVDGKVVASATNRSNFNEARRGSN